MRFTGKRLFRLVMHSARTELHTTFFTMFLKGTYSTLSFSYMSVKVDCFKTVII